MDDRDYFSGPADPPCADCGRTDCICVPEGQESLFDVPAAEESGTERPDWA